MSRKLAEIHIYILTNAQKTIEYIMHGKFKNYNCQYIFKTA